MFQYPIKRLIVRSLKVSKQGIVFYEDKFQLPTPTHFQEEISYTVLCVFRTIQHVMS